MSYVDYRKLIIRELKGDTSPEESLELDRWIHESPENQEMYHELWSAYQLTAPDVDLFFPNREEAWDKISGRISLPNQLSKRIGGWYRVAAAAVVFFTLGIAVHYFSSDKIPAEFLNQYSTFCVPNGQKSMIVLPDGSSVWLNSGSTLKYKNSFNSAVREVEVDGEAFFQVTKNPRKLFRVKSGELAVEVYGTSFDVKNYADERMMEVTVEEGKVGVFREGARIADLTRGKQVEVDHLSRKVLLGNAKVDEVIAWKNNELIFDDTPMDQVIRYLERWYGVHITVEEQMRKRHNYTFKVKSETLTELLKLLKVITPLQYTIDGKEVKIRYAN